mgnify:CR=1 FL=1
MAYKVVDKVVGLVGLPDYNDCSNLSEFSFHIENNGFNHEEYISMVRNNLLSKGLIDSSESVIYKNNFLLKEFDVETQTLRRERIFFTKEDYIDQKAISDAVDYVELFGEQRCEIIIISEEEV